MKTLLQIASAVTTELQLKSVSSVVGNTEPTAARVLRYADYCGAYIAGGFSWQALRRAHTFTATSGETQSTGFPSDFGRMIPETFYDNAGCLVVGPIGPQEWASLKAGNASPNERRYTRRNDVMSVYQPFAGGEACSYEYVTSQWCEDSGGTGQTAFAVDTDVPRLDDELMIAAICLQWLAAEGQPFAHMLARYQQHMKQLTGNDAPTIPILSMDAALTNGSGRHYDGVPKSRFGGIY